MPCFNNLFHKYSFGNNHLIRLILNKKKLGVGSFVLGAGEEKYKKILMSMTKKFIY